jgi:hypothetical protein
MVEPNNGGPGRKLFKFQLDKMEKDYNTRSEFLYRLNRSKFDTSIMRPYSFFAPFYHANGWILKGFLLYATYYYLFKSKPYSQHWNREGYIYESTHKTPSLSV